MVRILHSINPGHVVTIFNLTMVGPYCFYKFNACYNTTKTKVWKGQFNGQMTRKPMILKPCLCQSEFKYLMLMNWLNLPPQTLTRKQLVPKMHQYICFIYIVLILKIYIFALGKINYSCNCRTKVFISNWQNQYLISRSILLI